MRFFEDIEIGAQREFGSFTFTPDDIKKFAMQFDPQRFHLDEEEGRKSLFGGLAASGWHVAAVCMKLLVAAGDTISFSSVVETKRTSEKRPEWGIVQARNTGINQRGEIVYSFLATAFVPRRKVG
jgi:acyl dehydratase